MQRLVSLRLLLQMLVVYTINEIRFSINYLAENIRIDLLSA